MTKTLSVDSSVGETVQRITQEYASLSRQLQLIARYIERNQNRIGIEGVREIAAHCDVHPSAVIRFAKHFGFAGFSELQAVFRSELARQLATGKDVSTQHPVASGLGKSRSVIGNAAKEAIARSILDLQELESSVDLLALRAAVELLLDTDCIWIAASRHSLPIAVYLDIAMRHTGKRVITVNPAAGMPLGQTLSVRKGDVMIAVSFLPYDEEPHALAKKAIKWGAKLISISDSRMSPLTQLAHAAFVVPENTSHGFRSLSAAMSLVQGLFHALARKLRIPEASFDSPFSIRDAH